MSYRRKIEYQINPEESYRIIRNCSGCGNKSLYVNTYKFRVNANGDRLDVWLIYQCEKCKHTYNLSIYERVTWEKLAPIEQRGFMENDQTLALTYGRSKRLFAKNKAEIDTTAINFQLSCLTSEPLFEVKAGDVIVINNPENLPIRPDKLAAEVLLISRSQIKKLEKSGIIVISNDTLKQNLEIWIYGDIH